ncbi:hypothetical protein [Brevibacillus sp. SYSU BS000544]|uniref:hypothetical protein n=1 Tax=Brevibacillus sp. SYSU BS000544 TaxID=3416443 RepID=UPI003CE49437
MADWAAMTITGKEIIDNSVAFINAYWGIAALAIGAPWGISLLKDVRGIFN